MNPRIVRRTLARRDIAQTACFLADENVGLAWRFLESVEATLIALARRPQMGTSRHFRNPKFADVRMRRVKDFEKYLIFYRPRIDGIEVLRLVHGARDLATLFQSPWFRESGVPLCRNLVGSAGFEYTFSWDLTEWNSYLR